MTARPWNETSDLPERTTWLLEASAGTGKTYQISGLFLRLVAEHGVPVDRVLAITFTNAATTELRDRIRARLRDALAALRAPAAKTDDTIVQHLLSLGRADPMITRLELALRAFDVAPISTIHGFAQRMLQELAFDSGQDPELELLSDASEIVEQIVDDTLATLYARASVDEIAVFAAAGVRRELLLRAANAMGAASAPTVSPAGGSAMLDDLARVSAFCEAARVMRARWHEGAAAFAALRADVDAGRFNGRAITGKLLDVSLRDVGAWLDEGALLTNKEATAFRRLRVEALSGAWKGKGELYTRPYFRLIEAFDAFCEEHEAFFGTFAPLAWFARNARERVEREITRRRALTFDAMLSRLAERIAGEGGEQSPLAARIRERFHAVFVDEFQDTDDAQWTVIEAAFHRHRRLFLIGDPKQAIYAFRGADVHVYLKAKGGVVDDRRYTMVHNWRSDPRTVAAMNHLWRQGSGAFDQSHIDYVEVQAKRPNRLSPGGPGLEVRWLDARVDGGAAGARLTSKDNALAARLAAREAVAWLEGARGAIVDDRGAHAACDGKERRVEPADVAVLVNSHDEAQEVRKAFQRVGIPSVAASKGSVFATGVARWLAAWLDAAAGAGRDREARTAVVTPLFGWTGPELAWALAVAERGDEARAEAEAAKVQVRDWNAWTERLRDAAERWPRHGFARTFDREATDCGVYARVLSMPDGERHATDLRHLFELLHVEERSRRCGPAALATWLRAEAETNDETYAQRLESDARAVKIETVHVSKGLEYPIVLLPFGWSARREIDQGEPLTLRDESGTTLDVHVKGTAGRAAAYTRWRGEQRREGLRKLYVALTRAKHRTIAWYGPVGGDGRATSATPLGRLLMRDRARSGLDDSTMPTFGNGDAASAGARPWTTAQQRLDDLAQTSDGAFAWTAEGPLGAPASWEAPAEIAAELHAAAWPADRASIVGPWLVTSYSGLAAGSAAPDRNEKVAADPLPTLDDEARARVDEVSIERPPLETFPDLARLSLGRGTEYGTWVHGVFEELDFTTGAAKCGRPAAALVRTLGARLGFGDDSDHARELEAMLPRLLDTPLDTARGPARDSTREGDPMRGLPPGLTLRRLSSADRLDELSFDLRLGDGTAFRREGGPHDRESLERRPGCVDPRKVYDAILAAEGRASRWVAYQRSRRDAGRALIGSMVGVLTGSIDLVFRAGGRYFLADYKTNRIGTSAPGHYAGAWLDWEMATAGYPLQALLYTLALHRHLKARLRGYDYDAHVGGYLYLFLRGMSGPETPRDPSTGRCLGVLGDRWSKQVIEALDEALCPPAEVTR
ncbi:MAG: UvrD-helicase domain-containing protein [Deltaproteobacteria bacterium]|nr:UvrD-helicase domain-containing protein [Deltaproteobacteria bacterium]